jgi:CBS domain-containing protein
MRVRDLMSTSFKIIAPDTTLRQAAEIMRDHDLGYLPIGENDRLKGAVTDRDIVVRGIATGMSGDESVMRVMTDHITYCFEDDTIREAAEVMKAEQIRRLVVLNEHKRVCGIISLGDIAREHHDRHLTGDIETAVAQPHSAGSAMDPSLTFIR